MELVKGVHGPSAFWSRDGKRIYGFGYDPEMGAKRGDKDLGPYVMENWVIDLATGKKSSVAVPHTCGIRDESPDGRTFLTNEFSNEKTTGGNIHSTMRSFITRLGTKPEQTQLAPELGNLCGLSFSPDGKKVLALHSLRENPNCFHELLIIDVKTGKTMQLNHIPDEQPLFAACWSPDGTKVAYVWYESAAAPPGGIPGAPANNKPVPVAPPGQPNQPAQVFVGSHVTVVGVDGKNWKRIHTEPGIRIRAIDWR